MLQCQVWMPEASRSRRNRDLDVSSPSPSPMYIRLIQRQVAQVSDSETGRKVVLMLSWKQGKARGVQKGPCVACVSRKESCVWEDGKALCDGFWKRKVMCNLSGWKPCQVKVKRKGRSIIDSDEDALDKCHDLIILISNWYFPITHHFQKITLWNYLWINHLPSHQYTIPLRTSHHHYQVIKRCSASMAS